MNSTDPRSAEDSAGPEAIGALAGPETKLPVILSFVADWANIVSLLGLCGGVLAIYFALAQNYPAAIIAMLWAVLFDWYDGLVARATTKSRGESHKKVGSHMDSLVDLVTSAVGPAVLLISVSDFSAWSYPGALALIGEGGVRLAYFNVFGVDSRGTYAGITIDNSPIAVSAVFLLHGFLDPNAFVAVLYATILIMALLHVAPLRTRKLSKIWNYIFTAYVVSLTGVYSYILWTQ